MLTSSKVLLELNKYIQDNPDEVIIPYLTWLITDYTATLEINEAYQNGFVEKTLEDVFKNLQTK